MESAETMQNPIIESKETAEVTKVPETPVEPAVKINELLASIGTAEKLSQYMKNYASSDEGKGKTKNELIKHLIEVIKPAVLKTRVEVLDREDKESDQHENAHEEDNQNVDILDDPNVKIGRVLISKNRTRSVFDYELTFSANGIILDSDTWDLLVCPVKAFNPNINKKQIIDNFGKYKLYKMRDGTTVNLYYYGGSWCISTLNGYDVGAYRWMGQKTYMETLAESFYNLSRGAVGYEVPNMEVVFAKLNKDNCYSLGFRHPDYHPFTADSAGVWMIKSYNLKTQKEESMDELGFPQQIEISLESILPRAQYPGKSDTDYHRRVCDEIIEMCKKALVSFKKSNSNVRKNKNTIENSFNINYGFIFRAPFDECGTQSNVSIESRLYSEIRKFIYNQPYRAADNKVGVSFDNRLNYSVLRAFLNYSVKHTFITLFPQFDTEFSACKTLVEEILDKVTKLARFGNTGNTNYSIKGRKKRDIATDKFAEKIHAHIKNTDPTFGKGGRFDKNSKKIVLDYICNQDYTDIYFLIMNAKEQENTVVQ